jgi:RNA polymerase sigma-70 factor, ECF subfamily
MSARPVSDDLTISEAKAGSAEAWQQLYEHVGGRLVVWLKAQPQLDAALDADDLAHDAWVTAAGRIADFHGTVDEFTGWLFGIARNLTLNANRRTVRRATSARHPDELGGRLVTVDDDGSDLAAQLDWTRRLLAQLPMREAQVVACIDVVGLDVAATAVTLDVSATAVRVAHHRALRRLRTILDDGGSAAGDTLPMPTAAMTTGSAAVAWATQLSQPPGRRRAPRTTPQARPAEPRVPAARSAESSEELEPPIGVGTWS